MEYTLKRSDKSRSIRISLTHEGEVLVTAPRYALRLMIDQFVRHNEAWILKQQHKLELKKTVNPSFDFDQRIVSFMGRLYAIKFSQTNGDKVVFENGICWVAPITGLESDMKTTLWRWLKLAAEKELLRRTEAWARTMGVHYGTVRFGQQSSRWGSCTGEGNLRFNWRLIHFPAEVMDYVVIHELSHTVHHDHSERFWALVGRYCLDWKEHRKYLKRQMVSKEI